MKKIFSAAIWSFAFILGSASVVSAATKYGPVTVEPFTAKVQHNGVFSDTTLYRAIIDGQSDEVLEIPEDVVVNEVVVRRSFKAGKPQTMVLPFDLADSWRAQPLKFWRYAGMIRHGKGDWQFWTKGYSGTIDANTPFVVIADRDADSVVFQMSWMGEQQYGSVTLNSTKGGNMTVSYDDWKFMGTYSTVKWEKGHPDLGCVYGFAAKQKDGIQIGQFVKAAPSDTSAPYVRAGRAYLMYSPTASAAKRAAFKESETASIAVEDLPQSIEVVFDDESGTTAIGRMDRYTGEITIDHWVDLKGRKLDHKPTTKGTYYNNRQKVIIK